MGVDCYQSNDSGFQMHPLGRRRKRNVFFKIRAVRYSCCRGRLPCPSSCDSDLAVAAVPIYHLLIKKPAKDAGDKPPLRRRSSILVLSFVAVVATEAWTVFV